MTPAQRQLVETIRDRFGPRSVVTDPAEIEPWLIDWRRRFHGDTPAMLAPDSTEAVAAIVGLAAGLRVPLVPQGGNTGMVGGAVPPGDGSALLLSLRRLDRLRRIDADLARAQADAAERDRRAAERVALLEREATDAAESERLGREGQRRFADQFRHETMTRRIRELYWRVLTSSNPSSS